MTLKIIVMIETKPGQRAACVEALKRLFDRLSVNPDSLNTKVLLGVDDTGVALVEEWNMTPDAFGRFMANDPAYATFEIEAGAMIAARHVLLSAGEPTWQHQG
ncbi:hypothetical protein [Puniceibacterium sp. IMCC21224]|uniref:hypothetical protein n=1 Tax=Puniceibacterium sp. IMCC21224 TaxID=1618204 RepID=UPI00064DE17E|nr:hypothetical protein [Puniceibacterium sp. IMCC21224]KMK64499.1 hypothetical protein IMCC21224_1334 [Puniceibacterium sp. IMCC21224]